MPAEIVKTVGPGGGFNYLDLNAWVLGERRNLIAADEVAIAECYGGGNVGLNGTQINMSAGGVFQTDATRNIIIRAAAGEEHEGTGTFDTSKAYMEGLALPNNQNCLAYSTALHVTIEGMQFRTRQLNSGGGSVHCFSALAGTLQAFRRCLCVSTVGPSVTAASPIEGSGLLVQGVIADSLVENCIFMLDYESNISHGGQVVFYQNAATALTHTFRNNTVISTNSGGGSGSQVALVTRNGDTLDSNNNIYICPTRGVDSYEGILGGTLTKGANDITSDAVAITAGLRSYAYNTDNFVSVTLGTEDLTPTEEAAATDAGATIGAVTTDIRNLARPQGAAYDIGAVERAQTAEESMGETQKVLQRYAFKTGELNDGNEGDVLFTFPRLKGSSLSVTIDSTLTAGGGGFTTVVVDVEYSIDDGVTWLATTDTISASTTGEVTVTAISAVKGIYARVIARTLTVSGGTPTLQLDAEIRVI